MSELFRTTLEAATNYLIGIGTIKRDKDVVEALGISKGNFSAFKSGRTEFSEAFKRKFEDFYKISLNDFEVLVDRDKYNERVKQVQVQRQSQETPLVNRYNHFEHAPVVEVIEHINYLNVKKRSFLLKDFPQFQLLPGLNPKDGATWQYWEIPNSSNTLSKGDIILTSQMPKMEWFLIGVHGFYVFVTKEAILFGCAIQRPTLDLSLPSKVILYEESHLDWSKDDLGGQVVNLDDVEEIWVQRASIILRPIESKFIKPIIIGDDIKAKNVTKSKTSKA